MIPILFTPDERDFTSNGLGRLTDCRKFEVTEERNGIYEAYFEYPVDGPLFEDLKYGYFVYATHDESKTPQAFEIYSKEADMSGWASFRAWHISYQLNDVIVKPFTATSCADAMSKIPANEITPADFTFWTDKLTAGDFTLAIPKAARALLGGSQGSLLDVYGKGDYEFDMFAVKLHVDRGSDRGVSIRYGKNLTKLDQKMEGGNIVNGVVPYWESTDGDVVSLDYPIYGGAISFDVPIETHSLEILQTHVPEDIYAQYVNAKVRTLDLSTVFEEMPTQQQLADYAAQLMSSSTEYELQENLSLDFVALWQTEEYKNYASLQRVFLCDTVHIFYEKLGITAKAKVIKVIYDTLRERYIGMELGEPKTTFAEQITQAVSGAVMGEVRGLIKSLPDKNFMDQAIDYATQMIQGGLGGYVVIEPDGDGYPQEILIMDTPDKATAVNVWRFNQGGLGHSHTGYNGPFSDIALTADGQINASMITTGTMQVGRISGLLQDAGATWSIDFTNGTMVIGDISADNITSGTLDAARIAAGTIAVSQLDNAAQAALMTSASSKTQYYLSTSSSSATGGSWGDTVPTWSSGKYVWTRVATTKTFADGTTTTTYSPVGGVYDEAVTTALSSAAAASSDASSALSKANSANYQEQLIYKSAVVGTTSMSGTNTWVTNTTGNQNVWTTKRPQYSSSYPVLFIATQRQSVSASGGTTCTCTTPNIDQTTTVIDGGHITTGTIDASVVTVANLNADNIVAGTIQDASGLNYWDLMNGEFVTKQGSIGGFTIGQTDLDSGDVDDPTVPGARISPTGILMSDGSNRRSRVSQAFIIQAYVNGAWTEVVRFGVGEVSGAYHGYVMANGTVAARFSDHQIYSNIPGNNILEGDTNIFFGDLYLSNGKTIKIGSNGGVLEFH